MHLTELQAAVNCFVRDMGWYEAGSAHAQTPRNLSVSLVLEAAEVLEHYQWAEEAGKAGEADRADVAGELADVLNYVLQLATILDIDLEQAVLSKIEMNRGRQW